MVYEYILFTTYSDSSSSLLLSYLPFLLLTKFETVEPFSGIQIVISSILNSLAPGSFLPMYLANSSHSSLYLFISCFLFSVFVKCTEETVNSICTQHVTSVWYKNLLCTLFCIPLQLCNTLVELSIFHIPPHICPNFQQL